MYVRNLLSKALCLRDGLLDLMNNTAHCYCPKCIQWMESELMHLHASFYNNWAFVKRVGEWKVPKIYKHTQFSLTTITLHLLSVFCGSVRAILIGNKSKLLLSRTNFRCI